MSAFLHHYPRARMHVLQIFKGPDECESNTSEKLTTAGALLEHLQPIMVLTNQQACSIEMTSLEPFWIVEGKTTEMAEAQFS